MSFWSFVPFQKLRNLLNRPVGYGTVLTILVATLLMTTLFWKAQTPQMQAYTDAVNNLVELKYFDMRMERELEAARQFGIPDLQAFRAAVTVLRDLGQEYGSLSVDVKTLGYPVDSMSQALESELFRRISLAENLVSNRLLLRTRLDSLQTSWTLQLSQGKREIFGKLDTLQRVRAGAILVAPAQDTSLWAVLLATNQRQQTAFQDNRESKVQLLSDDLISSYRMKSHELLLSKERVTQAFYILSMLSILVVLVLAARMKK